MLLLATSINSIAADNFDATAEKIKSALNAEIRTESETDRDKNRKALQTLEFFGLREDMKIIELIPGSGWYTKILAPVVSDNGEYYAAIGTGRINSMTEQPGFEKIKIVAEDAKLYRKDGERFYSLEADSLGVKDLDMVLTFRNYHNFGEQGRRNMNKLAFEALKPGGVYAVVDHTARHMEAQTPANRRRIDPVLAIKEIQEAGFEFVDYTDLHYRADDELRYEVGVKSVSGNTDRWTIKFRKPN
ncbi:MAG: putative methyltransferase [Paraglaciecola sp.]|jgi:predicted methyltransferase|uniref:class I SAM-dependent methyltransferase n=1 Tax=uncultured Paraglaciecola sp. TaxID=1765024 RepID=UPI0025F02611|nr:methyltransferase [uncultured Paraglaciecola sp.]